MRRVSRPARSESLRLVRGDTEEAAEHGRGAGLLIGKQSRVRPLERREVEILWRLPRRCAHRLAMTRVSAKQGGTADLFALGFPRGVFFILGGRL